ncbi:MAG TPA: HipA family kinase [Verrucomicrobiae bacterium]|nr:HipA family kinase [Verrucomicrobiae bacterium]
MPIHITEIVSRSGQGITRPFLCRGDDGKFYYVKGNYAGRKALCAEWVAGRLGERLDLPIPPFVQAFISDEIVRYSARDDIADLGAGLAFGSEKVNNTDELRLPLADSIDRRLCAKILLFDWWTCNGDRTLSAHGGNPNLLWFARDRKVIVIDHNLAFEETEMEGFWRDHIFREDAGAWDQAFQEEMVPLLRRGLEDLPEFWRELPLEWTEAAAGLTLEGLRTLLSRFESDPRTFWHVQ